MLTGIDGDSFYIEDIEVWQIFSKENESLSEKTL
jgi:hypothetical protein